MSFIAAALAKSKGKDVPPPPQEGLLPPPGSGLPTPPAVQEFPLEQLAQKPSNNKRKLILGVAGVLLLVGVVVAIKIATRPAPPPPKPKPAVPTVTKAAPTPPAAKPATPAVPPAPAATKPEPTPTPAPETTATAPRPSDELLALVHKFNVSAVMSGPSGRARIDGKTYQVGDRVNADLTLVEIRDGQLFFKDTVGAVYAKRF